MQTIFKVIKFQLSSFKIQTMICFSVIVLNSLVSLLIYHFIVTPNNGISGTAGSTDAVALVWMFALGISFFKSSFKYMLSNGISRKTYVLANIYGFAIVSVVWSIVVTILVVISRQFTQIFVYYELIYKNLNPLSLAIWLFSGFFLFAMIGWFFNVIYYRSSNPMKILISFAFFALGPVIVFLSFLTNGLLSDVISKAVLASMGLSTSTPNSYIGALSMIVMAAVFCGFNFLLIRKAQIKE